MTLAEGGDGSPFVSAQLVEPIASSLGQKLNTPDN